MPLIEALEARTSGERFLNFNPQFTLFRSGFSLCVRSIVHLGDIPPKGDPDRALRDLACDSLDSLWLAEYALLHGYDNQSLLLLRRSYETTSLMAFFINFPDKVKEWKPGSKIEPSTIRKALARAPCPEPEDELRTMYKIYSLFAHVNRETVAERLLGEKNRLTLGCQGSVSGTFVGAVVRELLFQMMWLVDVFHFVFKDVGRSLTEQEREAVIAYRGQVQQLVSPLPALF